MEYIIPQQLNEFKTEGLECNEQRWITTQQGTCISRDSTIIGSNNIIIGGSTIVFPKTIIRGDLKRISSRSSNTISIGNDCILFEGCVIRPPWKKSYDVVPYPSLNSNGIDNDPKVRLNYFPVQIGNNVIIGEDSIVEASEIGPYTIIGANCIIGKMVSIGDHVKIADGSYVPPFSVIPSGSILIGNPAHNVASFNDNTNTLNTRENEQKYKNIEEEINHVRRNVINLFKR